MLNTQLDAECDQQATGIGQLLTALGQVYHKCTVNNRPMAAAYLRHTAMMDMP